MNLPTTSLTAEDIRSIWLEAQSVIDRWTQVQSSTSDAEVNAYRDELSQVNHAVETVEQYLENQVADWKKHLGSASLKLKELKNYEKMATRKYWQLRDDRPV